MGFSHDKKSKRVVNISSQRVEMTMDKNGLGSCCRSPCWKKKALKMPSTGVWNSQLEKAKPWRGCFLDICHMCQEIHGLDREAQSQSKCNCCQFSQTAIGGNKTICFICSWELSCWPLKILTLIWAWQLQNPALLTFDCLQWLVCWYKRKAVQCKKNNNNKQQKHSWVWNPQLYYFPL